MWVGHEFGGVASHHVSDGGIDLMPFTGTEAGCAGMHVDCSFDGGCDGGLVHDVGMVIPLCNFYSFLIVVKEKTLYLNRLYCRSEVKEGSHFGLPS
jgi:hypothetical protein